LASQILHDIFSKKVVVVVPQLQNPFLYKVAFEVISVLLRQRNSITVVGDVPISKTRNYYFNLHKYMICRLYEIFGEKIEIFGDTYPENCYRDVDSLSFCNESWIKDFLETGTRAALSGLATNKSFPANLSYLKAYGGREYQEQMQKFFQVGELAWKHLKNPVDLVIFPNGRFASQAPWRFFSDLFHRDFMSYEHGEPKNKRFHLQKFQPQETWKLGEWLSSSEKVPRYNPTVDRQTVNDWIVKQRSSSNKFFLGNNSSAGKLRLKPSRNTMFFFTSSIDERLSNLSTDDSMISKQIDWIKFLSDLSDRIQLDFSTRIHPNACNKSWLDLALLFQEIRGLKGISIHLPWSKVDTYSLLDVAKIVISYGSTVSLEAAYQGIKTATVMETKFSRISKIAIVSYENCKMFLQQDSPSIDKGVLEQAIFHRFNYGYEISQKIELEVSNPDTRSMIEKSWDPFGFLQKVFRVLRSIWRVLTLRIFSMNELNYVLPKRLRNSEFIFTLYFKLLMVLRAGQVRRLKRFMLSS